MEKQSKRLSVVQAALGAALGVYVVLHLWQQWPALEAREAWVDRARSFGLPLGAKLGLCLVFAGHALLGVLRLRAPHPADVGGGASLRRVQVGLALLVVAFLAIHVPAVQWQAGPHSTVRDVYAQLWDGLGKPGTLAIYLVGIVATCGHVGLGLGRAARTLRPATTTLGTTLYGTAAIVVAAALLIGWLQVLACFAIGEPLFFAPSPVEQPETPP